MTHRYTYRPNWTPAERAAHEAAAKQSALAALDADRKADDVVTDECTLVDMAIERCTLEPMSEEANEWVQMWCDSYAEAR